MIELTPQHLQIGGVAILVLAAAGFLWWTVGAIIGLHRGRPIYMLPDTHPDEHDDEPDDSDGGPGAGH